MAFVLTSFFFFFFFLLNVIYLLEFANYSLQDILSALKIPRALVLKMSFDRPNLKYEVIGKSKEPLKQLGKLLLDRFKNLCGIVYCLSKNECAEVSKYLNEKCKVKTVYYHAGLAAHQRVAVQKKWHTGEVEVVCATIAFGMGIDKPDVVSIRYISLHSRLVCLTAIPLLSQSANPYHYYILTPDRIVGN